MKCLCNTETTEKHLLQGQTEVIRKYVIQEVVVKVSLNDSHCGKFSADAYEPSHTDNRSVETLLLLQSVYILIYENTLICLITEQLFTTLKYTDLCFGSSVGVLFSTEDREAALFRAVKGQRILCHIHGLSVFGSLPPSIRH